MTAKWYGTGIVMICVTGISVACADSVMGPANDHFELAFTRSDRGSFASDLYVSRADGSHATRLTTNAYAATARWSPDGTQIAFVTNTQYTVIELINADGTGRHVLTSGAAAAWSPDGSRIGFTGFIEILFPGGGGKLTKVTMLYRINADGSNQIRIAPDSAYNSMGSWSPDGTRIVFTRFIQAAGNDEIFVMGAEGTNLVPLTANGTRNSHPAWSPAGAKIAFVGWQDPHYSIYTMNPDGSGLTRLTSGTADDMCPAWSPDGSRIAFTSNRDGFYQTYLMNADGSGQVRIKSDFSDTCPSWKAP